MKTAQQELFETIRAETNGYLSWDAYAAIYEAARTAPAGSVIDIGPAQGGSTVCLGLGRRDGGHAVRIYSLDMFRGSAALDSKTDTAHNVAVLRRNVARYGLADAVRVIAVGDEDPRTVIDPSERIAVLFIDADGALDRDFGLYYRQLVPGARIVIDDYQDVINRHARERYLHFTPEEESRYVRAKGAGSLRELVPLGKEYTTFRFANALHDAGLLAIDRRVGAKGSTLVGHKPWDASLDDRFDAMSAVFARIRDDIHATYLAMRSS